MRLTSILASPGRHHLISLAILCALTGCSEKQDPRTSPEAEAARLYDRASSFVSSVAEGNFSYSYMYFYWSRAESNIARIDKTYGETPTAQKLRGGDLKLGPYELGYFNERVLPRLKKKQDESSREINCAIFLWELPENKIDTPARKETLRWIIEYMSREGKRYKEALDLAIPEEDQPLRLKTVARVATTYHVDKLVDQLLKDVTKEERAYLLPVVAEAHGFRGDTAEKLNQFIQNNEGSPDVKLGVLRGVIRREIALDRTVAEKRPVISAYDGVDSVQMPSIRFDVEKFAKDLFPRLSPEVSDALKVYRSRSEAVTAPLKNIFELARLGQTEDAQKAEESYARQHPDQADFALYQLKRGQIQSFVTTFVVQPDTFSSLPIKDPNLIAQLILEWSLTPTRNQRGMSPYDQVVNRFDHGFDNLPAPEAPKDKPTEG